MYIIFEFLEQNLLVSIEVIILLIIIIAGVINYAKNPLLGLMLHFIACAGVFMAFYELKLNYSLPLICMFIFLILMCFSLFAVKKSEVSGGLV